MAKVDANAERAARLLQTLQQQKQGSGEYPLSADRLRQLTDPTISDPDLLKSLAHKTIAGQILLGAKKDVMAPVALAGDEALLAGSDLLLTFALGKLASADTPLHPINKIAKKIEAPLRLAFELAVAERLNNKTLPPAVGMREVGKKPNLYLEQFPPPPVPRSPAQELADSLLAKLREARFLGTPAMLLKDLVPGEVSAATLKAALRAEPFASTAIVLPVSKTLQVVGLDRGAILSSDQLLLALLQTHTTPKKPKILSDALAEKLSEADREAFRASLRARLAENRLPKGVLSQPAGADVELLLHGNLPAAHRHATELLQVLHTTRENSPASYPCRLADLFARVSVDPNSKLAKQILAEKAFSSGAIVAVNGQANSPVALTGDHDKLLRNPNLVRIALESMRSDDSQAVLIGDVGKKVVSELQPAFATLVERQMHEGNLPTGIGCLRINKKPYLFLLADAGAKAAPTPPPPAVASPAPIDFPRMFDAAFARLDRERGSHNLVSLVQLRQEIPLPRDQFDRELTSLRREGRYSLVGAEGRHGLSEEERTAGIVEHGHLLLFVSRRFLE